MTKYGDLLESALVEPSKLTDNFLETFTDNNKYYTIPTEMEYLLAYLQTKGRIIMRLFSDATDPLSQVSNFTEVQNKLYLFFQEINTFQYVLEKKTDKDFNDLIEKKLKYPFRETLLTVTDLKKKGNLVWKCFKTVSNFN